MPEPRPNSAGRGYGSVWRKRALAHLERVKREQEAEGWPGGPWCQCEYCTASKIILGSLANGRRLGTILPPRADTVDHWRKRRLFPLHLQGSDAPGGSDHPSNLRAMAHAHHSRRADDKARRRA